MIPISYFHQVDYFILEENTIGIETLGCSTSKIWGFELEFRHSKVNSGQNYFCYSKAHIIISYSIFDFNVFRVWALTSKSHLKLKLSYTIRKPIYEFLFDFYGHHLSISYRFEILDFKVFRVWPWPFTPKGHLWSKKIIPFESPYMTSYLTHMDNISLSRSVFEILNFKVFRVWPLPLTPRGHLGSKKIIPFESPSMTSYLTPMDNISLSLTVFEIWTSKFLGFDLDLWSLKVFWGHKILYHSKAIHDFLFNSYGQHLSISYRFRDIGLQSF